MKALRRPSLWPAWFLRETLEWGMAVALFFALPWIHYRQALAPQLHPVQSLRAVLEREFDDLQSRQWEAWAGRAMARIQQLAAGKFPPVQEPAVEYPIPVPPVPATRSAESPAALEHRKSMSSVRAPASRENILLRVSGTGPEDIVWTAVNEFYAAPYLYGGEDRFGVDCSALVRQVFGRLDVALPRTAQEQFDSRLGVYVDLDDLRPGDLLFFHTRPKPYISHVGIYLGTGEFLHAPRSGRRVEIAPLDDFYRRRFVAGKRVLADPFEPFQRRRNG